MFYAMKQGARRRHEAAVARENACIAAGCKCYCHEPSKGASGWRLLLELSLAAAMFVGFLVAMAWISQHRDANPPEPYVCNAITSTGAPTDCHPAVLPPDVLKKYEEQFKR